MRIALLAAWAAVALAASPARAADPAEGDWMIDDSARVHIGPCVDHPDRLCGVFVWMKDPNDETGRPARDVHNPDPQLRGRTLLGMPFMREFHRVDTGRWERGRIYNPDNGKSYTSRMHYRDDGTLKVEGCLLVFCGGQVWRRAPAGAAASR